MKTHYEHYLLGCRGAGLKQISFWRFQLAYGKYQREFRQMMDLQWDSLSPKAQHRLVIESRWLIGLANLVRAGERLAQMAARDNPEDEPGTAGAGDREPRMPLTPVLAGCAARALPTDDGLKEQYGWRV
jgi:hypothetical protein